MTWGKVISLMLFVGLSAFIVSCGKDIPDGEEDLTAGSHTEKEMEQREPKEAPPLTNKKEITIAAIGDMLIHNSVYDDARVDNGYDFTPMLKRVEPFIKDVTISIANQETMIGGVELGLSSYPSFNSPTEVGDALKWAGVDVVSIANNHTLDRGEEAIQRAIKHWETIDMMYTGSYKDVEDRNQIRVYESEEGISVAFLSYTYGTNGIPVPTGKDYLVNLIDYELIALEIKEAKEKADVVVLSLHFGNEYERMPNQSQKDLVQFAADQGADVVLGHHPHVLQPIDWVTGEDGNRTLVIYSLGNFLSGQDEFYRQIGGIFKFHITKTESKGEKVVEVHTPEFLPTYVKYKDWRDFEVIPMYQLTNDDLPNAKQHYEEIKEHMSIWVPDLKFMER